MTEKQQKLINDLKCNGFEIKEVHDDLVILIKNKTKVVLR